jgi:3D (Asp-Asp-Asp) domain-containing protein
LKKKTVRRAVMSPSPILRPLALAVFATGAILFIFVGATTPQPELADAAKALQATVEELPPVEVNAPIFEPSEVPLPHIVVKTTKRKALVTAYCPCHICTGKTGPWDERTTACGRPAMTTDGIATAWSMLPEGTLVYIPKAGYFITDDKGRAMREDAARGVLHIDRRMATHAEAKAWGEHTMTIEVVHITVKP